MDLREIISEDELGTRVRHLGEEIRGDYDGRCPVLVSVLKGATLFLADLVRAAAIDCEVDFMAISSYGSPGSGSGVVRIEKDLDTELEGRDVLVVEDIIDTGLTLTYLLRVLAARQPGSLRVCTLLDKQVRRIVDLPVDYCGFTIPDVFVVGYGLDVDGLYRNVSGIYAVDDFQALAADPTALVDTFFPSAGPAPDSAARP